MSTTITVNNDPIFYSTERNLSGSKLKIPNEYKNNKFYTGQLTYHANKNLACINTLLPFASKNEIYINSLDSHALNDTQNIILYCIAIIILASVLPLIFILMFTNKFSSRIITLRSQMHKASSGDYHIMDTFNGNDEISEVFSDLKIMIQSIKQLDSEMYEAKIKEQILKNKQQKMEFKMLSSQINPHFLYNTLETIRMKALTAGNKEVANAIKLLGKSMHYVLENTTTSSTTLKKELDYISTYLSIQKLRFGSKVNYTLNIPEKLDLEEYQILPLLLQPIVENAILHGLENTEANGVILIDVTTREDEFLIITISDNGQGMSDEELKEIKDNLELPKKSSHSSIGLHNINQRIKLFYGNAYGMEIKSKSNEGTTVTLTLPLHDMMEE
jgi:two-component system sensor histidine kinase YesM